MNFLAETMYAIKKNRRNPSDVVFIGSTLSGHSCTWEEFETLAGFEYDNIYGLQEVAKDLVIIFNDGSYLNRREYDGGEWWEFVTKLVIPTDTKKIEKLHHEYGGTLETIHEEEE